MILIDFRETDILALSKEQKLSEETVRSDTKLINGDLHICVSTSEKEVCPILVLERKKISDFQASLRDGRYSEQRQRLIMLRESNPSLKVG